MMIAGVHAQLQGQAGVEPDQGGDLLLQLRHHHLHHASGQILLLLLQPPLQGSPLEGPPLAGPFRGECNHVNNRNKLEDLPQRGFLTVQLIVNLIKFSCCSHLFKGSMTTMRTDVIM
jgi:hypothetical protein